MNKKLYIKFLWPITIVSSILLLAILALIVLANLSGNKQNAQLLTQNNLSSSKILDLLSKNENEQAALNSINDALDAGGWQKIKKSQRMYYWNQVIVKNPPTKINLNEVASFLCINSKQVIDKRAECLSKDEGGLRLFHFYRLRYEYKEEPAPWGKWQKLQDLYFEITTAFIHQMPLQFDLLENIALWHRRDTSYDGYYQWLKIFGQKQYRDYLVAILQQLPKGHSAQGFALKTLYAMQKTDLSQTEDLILFLLHEKDFKEAENIIGQALRKFPLEPVLMALSARLFLEDGFKKNYAKAYKQINEALAIFRKSQKAIPPAVYLDAGYAAIGNNDLKNAEIYLRQATMLMPKNVDAHRYLLQVYQMNNDQKNSKRIETIMGALMETRSP